MKRAKRKKGKKPLHKTKSCRSGSFAVLEMEHDILLEIRYQGIPNLSKSLWSGYKNATTRSKYHKSPSNHGNNDVNVQGPVAGSTWFCNLGLKETG